jgi:SAM-dependent methyltransferase
MATAERYAREWLEQQAVTGLLVAHEQRDQRRFELPPGHASPLVDEDTLDYVAWAAQLVAAFTRPLDAIVEAYRTGGGVPWTAYGADIIAGQAGQTRPLFVNLLATEWIASVPGLAERLRGEPPARVADVACGAGWAAISLARAFPEIAIDGIDLDAASIEVATANAEREGVADRVRFIARDAAAPELVARYDLVTVFEAIHDLSRPVEVLAAVRGMLAPGGFAIVADEKVAEAFAAPGDDVERLMYGFSLLHCLPVGMADAPSAGTGTVMRATTLAGYATAAGFAAVEVLPIENDFWRFYRLAPRA